MARPTGPWKERVVEVSLIFRMVVAHIGGAKISEGGKNFFLSGRGTKKNDKGGELFLKLRVCLGRGGNKKVLLPLQFFRFFPLKGEKV